MPADFENVHGRPCLLILDDLLNDTYSKEVFHLFKKGSHHKKYQRDSDHPNLFHQGRYCRNISLKAKYLVPLKNVREKNQFMFLGRQVYPENSISLYRAYLNATQRPYGYLVLDLSQDTNDHLRFRTNIFPSDPKPPIIYCAIKDEANEILSRSSRTKDGRTETAESYYFEL